jgi:positive regulator of sigma E activity
MLSALVLAGIVAKGIGVLLGLIAFGFVLGVVLTLLLTRRFSRSRRAG